MTSKSARIKSGSAHKNGWKDIQSKTKTEKKTKLALFILGLIVLIILFSQIVSFTQKLFSPWKLSAKSDKKFVWDGKFNINFLVKTKTISLLSYNPQDQKLTIVDIPDQIYLEVAHGFGKWQLGSVYELGQSQKTIGGNKLLKDTLINFFAVPIDGSLDFSGEYFQKNAGDLIDLIRKNPFAGFKLLSNLKTDLTLWELIRLNFGITSVRFDKIKRINLENTGILDKDSLADGTLVFTADPIRLDDNILNFYDLAIQAEHKSIAIFNATDKVQLAQGVARLITNLGGNVIITSNSQKKLQKTQITGEKSKTLKRLQQIFELSDKIDLGDNDLISSRAQINVFLGEDYISSVRY